MDNTDLNAVLLQLQEMKGAPAPLWVDRWPKPSARSLELTPLYIQRYVGPRSSNPLMRHSFWELTYVFGGKGKMLGRKTYALREGRTLLIPPGYPHAEVAKDSMDTLWVGIWGRYLETLNRRSVHCVDDLSLTPIADQLWVAACVTPRHNGIELDALTRLTIGRVISAEEAVAADWTGRVLQYMHDHLHRPITIAQIADAMGCSEGYLHRRFKQSVRQTPGQALLRMRLDRARHLMQHTGLNIKQISRRAGFRDPLYFSRVFSRVYGCPPREAVGQLRQAGTASPGS